MIASLCLAAALSASPLFPVSRDILIRYSAADPDGAQALSVNPAGLGRVAGWEVRGLHSTTFSPGAAVDGGGMFAAWNGIGAGYQGWQTGPRRTDILSLAAGRRLSAGVTAGAGYHDIGGVPVWEGGLLLRPAQYLSIGARGWDCFRRPVYTAAAALRPLAFRGDLEDRMEVSADYTIGARGNPSWLFRVSAEPWTGVILFASLDRTMGLPGGDSVQAGLQVNFSRAGVGSAGVIRGRGGYSGQATEVRVSQARWPALWEPGGRYLEVSVEGDVPEAPSATLFGARGALTQGEILRALSRAETDPSIAGVVLRVKDTTLGLGRIQEIRGALKSLRRADKKAIAILGGGGTRDYYLAAAGSEVVLPLSIHLDLVGLYARAVFFRDLLAKVGIEAHFERRGKYKSYPEAFTRREMSPEAREELGAILDDTFDQVTADIAADRGLNPADVRALVDRGPLSPTEAVEEKLADAIRYEAEIRKDIGEGKILPAVEYARAIRKPRSFREPRRIAILHVGGFIAEGRGGPTLFGDSTGDRTIGEALAGAREDSQVAAIIIRINSGGGDALASDTIRRAIADARREKPVMISMADMAASGGYLLAVAGDAIIAEPGTVTGSIGVFGAKISLKGLLEKIGIPVEIVKRGRHADVMSPHRGLDEEERDSLRKYIDFLYDGFTATVAAGRRLTPGQVEAAAQGRIWTARQALDRGLVDDLGGLTAAVARARSAAGMRPGEEPLMEDLPVRGGLLRSLGSLLAADQPNDPWGGIPDLFHAVADRPLFIVPYWMDMGSR